jgi:DNA mismatch repair ATPase MutS
MLRCELNVFRSLCDQVTSKTVELITIARFLAEVDLTSALSQLAVDQNYVRPTITRG